MHIHMHATFFLLILAFVGIHLLRNHFIQAREVNERNEINHFPFYSVRCATLASFLVHACALVSM